MATAKKTTAKSSAKPQPTVTAPRVSAVASNVNSPDQLVQASNEAVKDFISASTEEAKRTQEKVLSFSREHVETLTQSADQTVRTFNETLALSKEGVDAVMESGKIATELSKDFSERLASELNDQFEENVELAKEFLACRTMDDFSELQNRAMQNSWNRMINQSSQWADLWFKLSTDAAEPLNSQTDKATKRLNKTLAA